MWNLFNCYLSGRHEFSTWCEPGTIFLRCLHCGRRSPGWALDRNSGVHVTAPATARPGAMAARQEGPAPRARPHMLPLGPVAVGSHAS
jgi:hypothetical protein